MDFVRHGLLDPRILPKRLKKLAPQRVPSGRPTLDFEFKTEDVQEGPRAFIEKRKPRYIGR